MITQFVLQQFAAAHRLSLATEIYNFKRKLGKTKHHKFQTLTHVQL